MAHATLSAYVPKAARQPVSRTAGAPTAGGAGAAVTPAKVGAMWRDVAYALRERGDIMQLDRKTMEKLLSLSDRQLSAVLDKLGREYGLDLSAFQIRPGDLDGVRRTIRNMSDADLLRLGEQLKNGGKGR